MELIVNIKNKSIAEKIIKILEIFKNDGVEIKKKIDTSSQEKNNNLPEYDVDYENSIEYKLDRAEFREMKERL